MATYEPINSDFLSPLFMHQGFVHDMHAAECRMLVQHLGVWLGLPSLPYARSG